MAKIVMRNLVKTYPGSAPAIHDFNLEIEEGELLVLVGPSGSGKSTLLRMISGLEEINGGELYIDDKLVNAVPAKDRDVAMVFQSFALYPHLTIRQNIEYPLKTVHMPATERNQRVDEVADLFGIREVLDRRPQALSGGQKQRAALCRAAVRRPSVFLLDEPLSNLDAALRYQLRRELIRLHQKLGTTFIYVTHDQVEAMTMGDRIVVMQDGFLQQVGTPQELYTRPCNQFVAGFLGTPSMSFLDGQLLEENGHFAVNLQGELVPCPPVRDESRLWDHVGKAVVLGIRSEDIGVGDEKKEDSDWVLLEGSVVLTECTGADKFVTVQCSGGQLVLQLPSEKAPALDQKLTVRINSRNIHLFVKETGAALLR